MAENNEKIGGNGATNPNMRPGMPGRPGMGSSSPLNIPRHGPTGMPGMPGGMPGIGAGQQNNQGENPEEQNEQPSPVQQAKQAVEEQAKTELKKAALKKIILPILPYVAIGIVAFLAIYLTFVVPLIVIGEKIDDIKQGVVEFSDKWVNLLSGDGFTKSSDLVVKKLSEADDNYKKCSWGQTNCYEGELDTDILLATIHYNTYVSPEAYEESDEESQEEEFSHNTENPDLKIVDGGESHSFYVTQAMFLGDTDFKNHGSHDNALIYNLVDYKLSWTCTTETNVLDDYIKTAAEAIARSLDKQFNHDMSIIDITSDIYQIIRDAIASSEEGYNFVDYIARAGLFDAVESEQKAVITQIFQNPMPSCSPLIEGETETPRKAKPSVTRYNNYHNYLKYVSNVYLPTVAFNCETCLKDLSDEEKESYIRKAILEIVDQRNVANSERENPNYLDIVFKPDGTFMISTSVSTGGVTGFIPIGEKGTGWKQGDPRWGSFELVDGSSSKTMSQIGCYITSIAIIMANSGTTINSDTFDPGVLAQTLKNNGAIGSGGGVSSHAWNDLVPHFAYDHWISYSSFEQFERDLAEDINKGYHAIIHVYKDAKGEGHHFVAVVGIENGKIIISDPGYRGPDGVLIGDRLFTLEDYRYAIRGPIVSGRVFIDKSKGGN